MGGVLLLIIISIVVAYIGKSFELLKLPNWVGKISVIALAFYTPYYLLKLDAPYESLDSWDWFVIIFLGGIFAGFGLFIFNDFEKSGIFGETNEEKKKPVSSKPKVPPVFDHNDSLPMNPLILFTNLFAGGAYYCKYAGNVYQIIGCLLIDWRGISQLYIKNKDTFEPLLVESKFCHLIARSPKTLSEKEKDEMYIDGSDDTFSYLLNGIYPLGVQDFNEGVVLNIRNFEKEVEACHK